MLTATTLLLWLFQTCSHEILLTLILLGAVCVCVSVYMLVFRVVNVMFSIAIVIINFILRKLVYSLSQLHLRSSSPSYPLLIRDLTSNSTNTQSDNSILFPRSIFNLPQALANHLDQWIALEGQNRLRLTDVEQSANVQSSSSSSQELRAIPLRRSRRLRRARAIYSC